MERMAAKLKQTMAIKIKSNNKTDGRGTRREGASSLVFNNTNVFY